VYLPGIKAITAAPDPAGCLIKCKNFFADSVYVLGAAALLNTMPLKIELPPARSSKLGIDIHLCPAGLIGKLDTPDSHQIS